MCCVAAGRMEKISDYQMKNSKVSGTIHAGEGTLVNRIRRTRLSKLVVVQIITQRRLLFQRRKDCEGKQHGDNVWPRIRVYSDLILTTDSQAVGGCYMAIKTTANKSGNTGKLSSGQKIAQSQDTELRKRREIIFDTRVDYILYALF